jgi:thioredoxin-related protein
MRNPALSVLLCTSLATLSAQAPGPFDPARDSAKDLKAAQVEAQKTGRRIILDVGGNWCPWCHKLHAFWEAEKDVKALRDKNFVFVMVNYSPDNRNEAFLGQFPKVKGYPHLFVLDAKGKLLHSQNTGELEEGAGYSRARLEAFLKAWKP